MDPLTSLLALDDLAQKTGGGLKPALRDAILAQTRFPAHSAGPAEQAVPASGALPDNVERLHPGPDCDPAERVETDQRAPR